MEIRLKGYPVIDNLRHYPEETVESLRDLLTAGALAVPDPKRKNFYDVYNGSRVFYIHVCPTGKVLLLAMWCKSEVQGAKAREAQLAAACA